MSINRCGNWHGPGNTELRPSIDEMSLQGAAAGLLRALKAPSNKQLTQIAAAQYGLRFAHDASVPPAGAPMAFTAQSHLLIPVVVLKHIGWLDQLWISAVLGGQPSVVCTFPTACQP